MKKTIQLFLISLIFGLLASCNGSKTTEPDTRAKPRHHLNIPDSGIESMLEENSQKIIEGTDGSLIVFIGEITRKRVSVSLRRDQEIIEEKILKEDDVIPFKYEDNSYTLTIKKIKKPLVGAGKVEFSLK